MPSVEPEDRHSPDDLFASDPGFRDKLREHAPSAKLVARVLKQNPELSQGQLVDQSLLPRRTVRYALNQLEDDGLVESRRSIEDPRKQVYELRTDDE